MIDTQVHFREPGLEWKEDLETGSRAAVLGGVVAAVFEMPNTQPNTTDADALADKLARAKGRMHCDHAFYVGGTHENAHLLGELERLPGCCGVKVFMGASTGTLLVADDAGVAEVLAPRQPARHLPFRGRIPPGGAPSRWRARATGPAIPRCATRSPPSAPPRGWCGWRASSASASTCSTSPPPRRSSILADQKDVATVEVTPQHLTLEGPEAYVRLKGLAQMNPPIREARHVAGLWSGDSARGSSTCSAPTTRPIRWRRRRGPIPASPSGMPGVQTLLPVMLTHVAAGRLSLERLVDLTSAGAQRVFGIAGKGRLPRSATTPT